MGSYPAFHGSNRYRLLTLVPVNLYTSLRTTCLCLCRSPQSPSPWTPGAYKPKRQGSCQVRGCIGPQDSWLAARHKGSAAWLGQRLHSYIHAKPDKNQSLKHDPRQPGGVLHLRTPFFSGVNLGSRVSRHAPVALDLPDAESLHGRVPFAWESEY